MLEISHFACNESIKCIHFTFYVKLAIYFSESYLQLLAADPQHFLTAGNPPELPDTPCWVAVKDSCRCVRWRPSKGVISLESLLL